MNYGNSWTLPYSPRRFTMANKRLIGDTSKDSRPSSASPLCRQNFSNATDEDQQTYRSGRPARNQIITKLCRLLRWLDLQSDREWEWEWMAQTNCMVVRNMWFFWICKLLIVNNNFGWLIINSNQITWSKAICRCLDRLDRFQNNPNKRTFFKTKQVDLDDKV